MNKLLFLTLVLFIANGCSGVKEAFDPQRKNGSEEFLVEKKAPLSIPPNFYELPIPKSEKPEEIEQKDDIKSLILDLENNQQNSSNKEISSENNLEISILNQINKN